MKDAEDEEVFVNVPQPGDYLLTLTTRQATFRIVARVSVEATLIFRLHTDDRLAQATVKAGTIHAPGETGPVADAAYAVPQIWRIPPYATLFAWPARGGIGAWDEVFTPDPCR